MVFQPFSVLGGQNVNHQLGGGFKYVLFLPLFGKDSHFDKYFSNGLKPPTSQTLQNFHQF